MTKPTEPCLNKWINVVVSNAGNIWLAIMDLNKHILNHSKSFLVVFPIERSRNWQPVQHVKREVIIEACLHLLKPSLPCTRRKLGKNWRNYPQFQYAGIRFRKGPNEIMEYVSSLDMQVPTLVCIILLTFYDCTINIVRWGVTAHLSSNKYLKKLKVWHQIPVILFFSKLPKMLTICKAVLSALKSMNSNI